MWYRTWHPWWSPSSPWPQVQPSYNPATWPVASFEYHCQYAQYGQVRVSEGLVWAALQDAKPLHNRYSQGSPISKGTLVLVEVSRLPRKTTEPQVLCMWHWRPDADEPDLDVLWRSYVRHFDLEHTYRFFKQTLNWTTPRIRHPEQADLWSWLVLIAYTQLTQLRLARYCVVDQRLPWERPVKVDQLTPFRVRRRFWPLLLELGTPAQPGGSIRKGPAPGRQSARATNCLARQEGGYLLSCAGWHPTSIVGQLHFSDIPTNPDVYLVPRSYVERLAYAVCY